MRDRGAASVPVIERLPEGVVQQYGRGAPTNSQPGFVKGCLYQNLSGSAGSLLYINTGSVTSSTWLNIA